MFSFALRRSLILASLLFSLATTASLPAQITPSPSGQSPNEAAIRSLINAIETQELAVKEKRSQLDKAVTPEERKTLYDELTELTNKLNQTSHDLTSVASGIPYDRVISDKGAAPLSLQKEINDLLVPVISVLKEATEKPRAIESLTNHIESGKEHVIRLKTSIENIKKGLPAYQDPTIKQKLETILGALEADLRETENDLNIQEHRRDDLKAGQKSLLATSSELFSKYFQVRLLNLFLALATFVILSFGARLTYQYVNRFSFLTKRGKPSFYRRLTDVLYYSLTFFGAIFAAILVLYVRGDWMLLSLGFLFLAGLALVAKNAIPHYYDQTRLLLNLGEIREGERIVINEVPWLVESLNFFTTLSNPRLTGGQLRIPIRQLSTMVSRPFDPKEPWFPSEEGDWVSLDDGAQGRVLIQTPEQVQMVFIGGTRKTYSVSAFLNNNPRSLSHGFRISTIIGLDYSHQKDIARIIPDTMQSDIHIALLEEIDREHLHHVFVEFATSSASSLNLYIGVDLTGDLAPKHDQLTRTLHRLALESCEQHGWDIALPQLNVHLPKSSLPH
ncbi:hypothetical protein BH11VER1_BH11VER1_17960 [soil metagenome]